MPRAVSAGRKTLASASPAWVFVLAGLAAAITYIIFDSAAVSGVIFAVVGAGAAGALVVGSGRHNARPRWPWLLLAAASALFVVGAIMRPWSSEQPGAAQLTADGFTVPGYVLMFAALVGFLTVKHGPKRHAVIDGMLIGLGAGLIFALLFSVPAAGIDDRSAAVSTVAGLYPIFDLVLVLLVANVAFTTSIRGPSYLMLIGSMVLLLAGDIGYAIIGVNGTVAGNRLFDLPFVFGFVLIGACALHPSMRDIGRRTPLPVQAWSWRRLALIIPAMAVPFVLLAAIPDQSLLDRIVLAVGGALMVALLLLRAVSAVQAYAAAQREYEYQATHDHLTALPNRALLVDHVGQTLAKPRDPDRPLWLFFLDLDGFKLVNDSWGHYAGDRVIVEVARRLRRTVPAGAAVARVGGDEFVIAHVSSRDDAIALAERILASLTLPLKATASDVVVSGSIGIAGSVTAALPKTDDEGVRDPHAAGSALVTAEGLLRDADTAMYQAKAEGRGRWVLFDSTMHDRVRDRIDIELALRHALAHDQLRLAYQPIVRLGGARLTGVEALIRWEHPTKGTIAPTKFIPVAEETGLITDLGRWVMREALRQLAEWRKDDVVNEDFWLSINVSPRQLRDPRLPGELNEALVEHGLDGASVMLEITESVMVDGSQVTDQVMAELRGLGVRLVVDDFGTGFSALGYLRRHPVTGVKIDRSFVGGLGTNPEDEEIVRAVVAMSSALGLTVVAEGVQTQAQRDVLQALGVVYGQGWLWGRPQDPETFARLRQPAAIGRGGALAREARPEPAQPKQETKVSGFPRLGPPPDPTNTTEAERRLLDPIPGEPAAVASAARPNGNGRTADKPGSAGGDHEPEADRTAVGSGATIERATAPDSRAVNGNAPAPPAAALNGPAEREAERAGTATDDESVAATAARQVRRPTLAGGRGNGAERAGLVESGAPDADRPHWTLAEKAAYLPWGGPDRPDAAEAARSTVAEPPDDAVNGRSTANGSVADPTLAPTADALGRDPAGNEPPDTTHPAPRIPAKNSRRAAEESRLPQPSADIVEVARRSAGAPVEGAVDPRLDAGATQPRLDRDEP
ncbi:EAL domain-containing protein [Asanoa sp. WMMD1127]|uniref:EAL domain-containing protein n=1 Tax=Asanoa sp. WMMD1127 TaxID=3016107 RepID=UPI002417E0CD|nr:EAL domain-containing protein [Asanoa sp. WMMD1127]MDG4824139.1 EAL domain-containing protein [Asanoa sp. WMMD1127]